MSISRRTALGVLGTLAGWPFLVPGRACALPPVRSASLDRDGWEGPSGFEAGHEVMFSSRHPEELKPMARQLGSRASVGLPPAAAEFGTVL